MVNSTFGLCRVVTVLCVFFASALYGSTAAVRLEQIGTTWSPYGKFLYIFQLTNESGEFISYEGHDPSSPVYSMQFRRIVGWKEEAASWCGVGIESRRLAAGRNITFTISQPEGNKTWRAGVEFSPDSGRSTAGAHAQSIWSLPLRTSSVAVDRAARDASHLVMTEVTRDSSKEYPYTFTLRNTSSESLFYGGFREPHIPPIYLNQERDGSGWRDDGSANWCGTGFGFKELRPGKSVSFSIPAQSLDRKWRIGMRLYRNAAPKTPEDAFRPVWWSELPPREKGT